MDQVAEVTREMMAWGQGTQATRRRCSVAVLADLEILPQLQNSTFGQGATAFFVPRSINLDLKGEVFTYDGDFRQIDAEITVGAGLIVQLQSFAVAEFLSVPGPSIVSVTSSEDENALVRHIDVAREFGEFPSFFTEPHVVIGDRPSLGIFENEERVSFIFVKGDEIMTSPFGISLGSVEDSSEDWVRQRNVNFKSTRPILSSAPSGSIARYVAAVDALRFASARGILGLRVSGFGGSYLERLDEAEKVPYRHNMPVLLHSPNRLLLHAPASGRTFDLTKEMASMFDVVLSVGPVNAFQDHRHIFGTTRAEAESAVEKIQQTLITLAANDATSGAAGV